MSLLSTLTILLVLVCATAARPTEVISLNTESSGDISDWNLRHLSVGSPGSAADSAIRKLENKSALPGNPYKNDRLKRSTTSVQSHNGVRYNGITIKLPEGDGLANLLASSSTEKPRSKPVNRLARIHIRIG